MIEALKVTVTIPLWGLIVTFFVGEIIGIAIDRFSRK